MTLVYLDQAEEADGLVAPGPRSPIIDPLFADAVWYVDARLRADGTSLGATSGLDASSVVHVAAGDVAAGTYAYETSAAHCPDAADIDLTDGFCVAVDVTTDWRPTVAQRILAKPRTGDPDTNDCYAVGFDDSGHPFIEWHDTTDGHNGPAFITGNGATANVTFDDGVARRHLV